MRQGNEKEALLPTTLFIIIGFAYLIGKSAGWF